MPVFFTPELAGVYRWVNPSTLAGDTIISSTVSNPKTAFASATTIPEQTAVVGGVAEIRGSGLFGSGIVALSLTVSIEMAGQVVATVSVTPALSLVNMPWNIEVKATILASGQVEIQGQASFASSLTGATVVNIRNTTPFTMSVVGGVPVTISAQWGALAIGGTITLRQMIVTAM